jgi:hypothetical protein
VFAAPTAVSFPVNGGTRAITVADAGGGAGAWSVTVAPQQSTSGVTFTTPPAVTVPGQLAFSAQPGATTAAGDYTGFVILTRGTDTRRIPFWLEVSHPLLGTEHHRLMSKTGLYSGTTLGGASKVTSYRYPTGGQTYPGPEVVYRVNMTSPVANFGVAVVSGHAVPHIVYAGDEDHLVGYPGLPQAINPYLDNYGQFRPIAAAILPLPGSYDIVFDTRSAAQAGPFSFRYWVNDTTPPVLRLLKGAPARTIRLSAVDSGAGVDPTTAKATLNGKSVPVVYSAGRLMIKAAPGTYRLSVQVSDYQESKNMEDVAAVTPNTATLTATVHVAAS